jgi:hypothetical protein
VCLVVLVFSFVESTAPPSLSPEIMVAWAQSDSIAIATVREIHECPRASPGIARVYQRMEFEFEEALFGELPGGIVGACRGVESGCLGEADHPKGSAVIVFSRTRESLPAGCRVEIMGVYPRNRSSVGLFKAVADECLARVANVRPRPMGESELASERLTSSEAQYKQPVVDLRVGGHGNVLGPTFFAYFLGDEYSIMEMAESPTRDRVVMKGSNGRHEVAFVAQLGSRCPPRELVSPARFRSASGETVWSAGWPRSFLWVTETELAFVDGYPGEGSTPYIYVYNVLTDSRRVFRAHSPVDRLVLDGEQIVGVTAAGSLVKLPLEALVDPRMED